MPDPPTITDDDSPRGPARRRRERSLRRTGWGVSAAIHMLVTSLVIVEIALAMLFVPPLGDGGRAIELAAANEPLELQAQPLATLPIELPPDSTAAVITERQIAELAASQLSPQLAEELRDTSATAGDSVAAQWVQSRVLDEIAAAEKATPEDQFRRLEELTGTLNDVATEQSVQEATAQLARLLNTKPRATEPAAEPPPGEFEIDSAQLYDIKRADNGRGGFNYTAILLDADGRTLESELTEAEGEQLFRTFELMKANPLLARVYRGVVMSLLDKLLKPAARQAPLDK